MLHVSIQFSSLPISRTCDDFQSTSITYLVALCGGILAFGVHIVYYDVDAFEHKLHAIRRGHITTWLWFIVHLPMSICIVCVSIGFEFFLASTFRHDDIHYHHMSNNEIWLFYGSNGLLWLTLSAVGFLHEGRYGVNISKRIRQPMRLMVSLLCLVLGLIGDSISPIAGLATLTLYIFTVVVTGVHGSYAAEEDETPLPAD